VINEFVESLKNENVNRWGEYGRQRGR
jgi:hypothetical protein